MTVILLLVEHYRNIARSEMSAKNIKVEVKVSEMEFYEILTAN